jgi:hypothetical protein
MRAWIEHDDDIVPILSIETVENGKIVAGTYKIYVPFKWHLELGDIPNE